MLGHKMKLKKYILEKQEYNFMGEVECLFTAMWILGDFFGHFNRSS
jgi:hypothetical protein